MQHRVAELRLSPTQEQVAAVTSWRATFHRYVRGPCVEVSSSDVRFIAARDTKGKEPTPTCLWLLDRRTFVAALPPSMTSSSPALDKTSRVASLDAYARNAASYKNATAYGWPTAWNSLVPLPAHWISFELIVAQEALPPVFEFLVPLKKELFALSISHPLDAPDQMHPLTFATLTQALAHMLHICSVAQGMSSSVLDDMPRPRYRPLYQEIFRVCTLPNAFCFQYVILMWNA